MVLKFCIKCVETNTRPSAKFDKNQICTPCKYLDKIKNNKINWNLREQEFIELTNKYKKNSYSKYDCIIGVSGGKDSTRQALFLKKNNLNPLLVSCQYPPEQQTDIGNYNLENLIKLGFDTVTITPAPVTSKKLMLKCLKKYGNLFNASELALYSCLPRLAIAYNISMIVLGENPALAWNNYSGKKTTNFNGNNMRNLNTLKGGNPRNIVGSKFNNSELFWYFFPKEEEIKKGKIKIIYLSHFIKNFNDHTNASIAKKNGLKFRTGRYSSPIDTGGIYNFNALDDDFVIVNQYLKYLKFGFGKAGQEIGSAIRFKKITRKKGVQIMNLYDGKINKYYIKKLCIYLNITINQFWKYVYPFINKDLFYEKNKNVWERKFKIK